MNKSIPHLEGILKGSSAKKRNEQGSKSSSVTPTIRPTHDGRQRMQDTKARKDDEIVAIMRDMKARKDRRLKSQQRYQDDERQFLLTARAEAAKKKAAAENIMLDLARRNLEKALRRAESAKAKQAKAEQAVLIYVKPMEHRMMAPAEQQQYAEQRNDEKKGTRFFSSDVRDDAASVSVGSTIFSDTSSTSSISKSPKYSKYTGTTRVMYDDEGRQFVVPAASLIQSQLLMNDDSFSLYSCGSVKSNSNNSSRSSNDSRVSSSSSNSKESSKGAESVADSVANSLADTLATSLSKLSASDMPCVKESQPLGGPKYYVATITKNGQAKVINEAMPAMGNEDNFKAVAEERGYEIIEYHLVKKYEDKEKEQRSAAVAAARNKGFGTKLLSNLLGLKQEDDDYLSSAAFTDHTYAAGATGLTEATELTGASSKVTKATNSTTTTTRFGSKLSKMIRWKEEDSVHSFETTGTSATGLTDNTGMTGDTELTELSSEAQNAALDCCKTTGALTAAGGCAGMIVYILLM